MKPLRRIKPNPDDPTWAFPFATRQRINKLRWYFTEYLPHRQKHWKCNKVLDWKTSLELRKYTKWPSVPEEHRERVEVWFQRKVKEVVDRDGFITDGKFRSLKMNAANFGRSILTRKREANRFLYKLDKRVWLAYVEWEESERQRNLPRTPSRFLDVG
jgi:hypothetical protein